MFKKVQGRTGGVDCMDCKRVKELETHYGQGSKPARRWEVDIVDIDPGRLMDLILVLTKAGNRPEGKSEHLLLLGGL